MIGYNAAGSPGSLSLIGPNQRPLVFFTLTATEKWDCFNNLFSGGLLIIEGQGLVTDDTRVSQNTIKQTNT